MGKKLLIDATHAEETRVVVVDGNKVEEFDFETIHKRQLAGNIYLAKITRVEPSLQAAFVDYGGNRHGFLAFAEIHPDYYQIPVADRQALIEEERALAREHDDDNGSGSGNGGNGNSTGGNGGGNASNGNGNGNGGRRSRRRRGGASDDTKSDAVNAETSNTDPDNKAPDNKTRGDDKSAADTGADTKVADPVAMVDATQTESALVEGTATTDSDVSADAPGTPVETPKEFQGEAPERDSAPAPQVSADADVTGTDATDAADTASEAPAPSDEAVAAPEAVAEADSEAAPETPAPDTLSADTPAADTADTASEGTATEKASAPAGEAAPAAEETSDADSAPEEGTNPNPSGGAIAANSEGVDKVTYGAMDVVDLGDEDAEKADDSASDDSASGDAGHTTPDASVVAAESTEDEPEPYRAADFASQNDDQIESVADEDVQDEVRPPRRQRTKRYKIQEVIKVRQIMLVQVVKEERGNKGAALTTYLSLAGRYCVLMPNTARGGGISRKITNAADRKKLKEIAGEITVPEGAGLIIRTAGANRTKPEIRRDYEYLFRVWELIRELTLKSIAPAPIYEEGNLIKRSIRDLYNRDIDEVLVEGEGGYRTAKDFMKMIMPSHAKNVKLYRDQMPLFARFQVESYLGSMFNPTVQLKSGGYIVIGVTEALVAIDVNSGKSTREGSIEDTALKTNLEAADEVARQLRLRDLAGLIVIDFIDMEERRNNTAVEKRMKDALRTDRARIQVGRISAFGLMEMSRQRLRPGMIEATTQPCAHCHGTGLIRSDNSLALQILRALEEEGTRNRTKEALVKAPIEVVNYLFNSKRERVAQIEARYGMSIRIEADTALISPDYTIEKFKTATRIVSAPVSQVVSLDAQTMSDLDEELSDVNDDSDDDDDHDGQDGSADESNTSDGNDSNRADGGDGSKRKRRRRRRRRGGNDQNGESRSDDDSDDSDNGDSDNGESNSDESGGDTGNGGSKIAASSDTDTQAAEPVAEEPVKPARKRRSRARSKPAETEAAAEAAPADAATQAASPDAADDSTPAPKKRTRVRRKPKATAEAVDAQPTTDAAEPAAAAPAPAESAAEATPSAAVSTETAADDVAEPTPEIVAEPAPEPAPAQVAEPAADPAPQAEPASVTADPVTAESAESDAEAAPVAAPSATEPASSDVEAPAATTPAQPPKPRRVGWWSRKA